MTVSNIIWGPSVVKLSNPMRDRIIRNTLYKPPFRVRSGEVVLNCPGGSLPTQTFVHLKGQMQKSHQKAVIGESVYGLV